MHRSAMVVSGTVLGAAAVMVMPTPSKPQQVALASNAPNTTTTTHTQGGSKVAPKPSAAVAKTVVGSLQTTQYGQLQVKLTVKSGRITNVGFTTFLANDGHSAGIDQTAAPVLIRETIIAQNAHIQGVSGATYTTSAYEQSLQAAIDKAALHA
jgi:uncharacterized protein with FMN-binding domain